MSAIDEMYDFITFFQDLKCLQIVILMYFSSETISIADYSLKLKWV